MGKLRSLLTVVIVSISLVLGSVVPINSNELTTDIKYEVIKEYVRDDNSFEFLISDTFNPTTGQSSKFYISEENTAIQSDFPWTYIRHYMTFTYKGLNDNSPGYFAFTAKDYQEFVTADSKGVTLTKIVDRDMDGIVDRYMREYYIVINGNNIIMPDYPEGYINPEWTTPTEAELNRFLQRELDYWMKLAGKEA